MKQTIATLTVLFAFVMGNAQPHDPPMHEKKEKLDAMKAAYITEKLDLSTEEAQQFWPVYNEMDKKIHEKTSANRAKMRAIYEDGGKENVSDEELNALMEERFDMEVDVAKLRKTYHQKFVKLLGVQRTADLYKAELTFRRELMRKARGRSEGKRQSRDR